MSVGPGRRLPSPDTDPIAPACGVDPVPYTTTFPEGLTCHYCKERPAKTRDHVVARSKLGADDWWNLVPCCVPCNKRKDDKETTCHCAFCVRAVFLFELGHRRPPGKSKPHPPEMRTNNTPKKRGGIPNKPFAVRAAPLPDDLSHEAYLRSLGADLPPSFPGSS